MKKYKKYLLLMVFISLLGFTTAHADYVEKCELDVSQKIDWAAGYFEPNAKNIKISELSEDQENQFLTGSNSFFSGYMNLAPRAHYTDAVGCEGETKDVEIIGNNNTVFKTISMQISDDLDYGADEIIFRKDLGYNVELNSICTGNDPVKNCSIKFQVKDKNNTPKQSPAYEFQYTGSIISKKIKVFPEFSFEKPPASTTTACGLESDDISFIAEQLDLDAPIMKKQKVTLQLKTKKKCDGIPIAVKLVNAAGLDTDIEISNTSSDSNFLGYRDDYIIIESQEHKDLWLSYTTHEDGCNAQGGDEQDFWGLANQNDFSKLDCRIYVQIYKVINKKDLGSLITGTSTPWNSSLETWKPKNLVDGIFGAECDGVCDISGNAWSFVKTNGKAPFNQSAETAASSQYYDSTSPCFDQGTKKYTKNCYEFLAPLQGIERDADTNQKLDNFEVRGNRIAIVDITKYKLGDYVNKLFQMAISILGILAVIMIVIAGVQYMTVESIYGKSDAKGKIIGAVTGLLLSLGIFVILNTINPQLLQINFGSNLDVADIKNGGGLGLQMGSGLTPERGGGDSRNLDPEWAVANAPTLSFTNASGSTVEVRACDTNQFESYEAFGKTINTRKELKTRMLRISQKWEDMGNNKYPIKSIGGYSCRTIGRPGTPKENLISTHAYGVTLDINPTENPMGSALVTDMPESFRKLFTDEGFGWGGNWNSIKDAMHFSKTNNEQGDQKF